MKTELNPTLWRTCRVLANHARLRLLEALIQRPAQSVSELADRTWLPVPVTSQYLRALNARGLLHAHRMGPLVVYSVQADESVPQAKPLVTALRQALNGGKGTKEAVFETVTAYTHPRRVLMTQLIASGVRTKMDIMRASGISGPAINRHLAKLRRRSVIAIDHGQCFLLPPGSKVARVLLQLATSTNHSSG